MLEHGSRAGMSVRRLNPKWPNARIHALEFNVVGLNAYHKAAQRRLALRWAYT
jgi:hypothetical protein